MLYRNTEEREWSVKTDRQQKPISGFPGKKHAILITVCTVIFMALQIETRGCEHRHTNTEGENRRTVKWINKKLREKK